MSQRVDPTTWFTRLQSDARYAKRTQTPLPPTGLSLSSSSVVQTAVETHALLNIHLTPPATPSWSSTTQYVQGYKFTYSYNSGGVITRSVIVPFTMGDVYAVEGMPAGAVVAIAAQTIDFIGQLSASSASITVTAPSDTVPPAARTMAAVPVSDGVVITLDALNTEPDFAHYELWRGEGATSATVNFGTSPVMIFKAISVEDRAIPTTAADYFYKVISKDFSGNGASSNLYGPLSLTSTGVAAPPAPNIASGTIVTNADGSITLTWPGVVFASLAGYLVYRRLHGTTQWIQIANLTSSSGVAGSFNDAVVTAGTQYDYTVTSYSAVGDQSVFPAAVLTITATPSSILPFPVGAVAVTGRTGGVYVVWTVTGSPTPTFFGVSYRLNAASAFSPEARVDANQFTVLGLTAPRDQLANNLQIQVVAYNADGLASVPNTYTVTFPDLAGYRPADSTIPAAPFSVSPTKNDDGSVLLSWPASISVDRAGYQVEKFDSLVNAWDIESQVMNDSVGTQTYRVAALEPFNYRGKQYRFRVRTIDYSGNISSINMLENPSFETGTTANWAMAADVGAFTSIVSSPTNNGSFALDANQAARPSQTLPVAAGFAYTFSAFMAQSVSSSSASVRIEWLKLDTSLSAIRPSDTSSLVPTTLAFQRISVSGIAPADAAFAQLYLYGNGSSPATRFLWDDAQFEQSIAITAYNNARTDLVNVIDQVAPVDYSNVGGTNYLNLTATGALGCISLRWQLPPPSPTFTGAYDYIDSVFEIWRQVTSSSQPGLPVDLSFRKISERRGAVGPILPAIAFLDFDDLDPDETFNVTASYKLKARDRFGNVSGFLNGGTAVSAISKTPNDIAVARKDGLTPSVPTSLNAIAGTDATVTLTWTGSSTSGRNDLGGYHIFRRKNGAGSYVPVGDVFTNVDGGSQSWVDSGLDVSSSGGTTATYDYTVSAFDTALEESAQSSASGSVIPIDNRTPGPPSNVAFKGSIGGIQISWTASPTQGVSQYRVFIPDVAGEGTITTDVAGNGGFIRLPGGPSSAQLTAAGFYTAITVQAYSVSGGGSLSSSASPASAPEVSAYIPIDTVAPADPSAVTVAADGEGVATISWTGSSSVDVFSYVVEMATETAPLSGTVGSWVGIGITYTPTTSLRISGLQPTIITGLQFQFRVKAIDNSNNASNYATSSLFSAMLDTTPPAVPSGIVLSPSLESDSQTTTSRIGVSWTKVTDRDLAMYILEIFRTDGSGGHSFNSIPPNTTSHSISSLKNGVQYGVIMYSQDSAGNRSAGSTQVNVTTPTPGGTNHTPGPPTISSVTSGAGPDTSTSTITVTFTVGYGGGSSGPEAVPAFTFPADNDLSYASIRRATSTQSGTNVGPQSGTKTVASNATNGTSVSYTEVVARNGDLTSYTLFYKVQIVDLAGAVSTPASEVSVSVAGYDDGGTGDPLCPAVEMYLADGCRVDAVEINHPFLCLEDGHLKTLPLLESRYGTRECVRLYAENGCAIVVSCETPMELPDKTLVRASEMEGREAATLRAGNLAWSRCHVEFVGPRRVRMAYLGGAIFAAGESPGRCIFTHNPTLPKK